jgi:hypothetical protein
VRIALKGLQGKVFRSPHRFRVLTAGRRFGKTYLALTELCQAAWGERRLLVNPCCKRLIHDLERVSWKGDSNDNLLPQLDKTNPALTHVSDALGYLIETEFALRQMGGPKSAVLF